MDRDARSGRQGESLWPGAAALAALLAFSLGACASLDVFGHRADFEDSQRRFTQYVRWGKFTSASEFVAPDMRAEFLALAPDLSDVRFTDYEILHMDLGDDLRSATVDVRYSGYLLSAPIERTVDLTQQWTRDTASGRWLVRLELARIRDALRGANP